MKPIKLYEQFINEASVPSNIKEFAKRKGVTALVNRVAGWAEKVGARISGGTAIGKDYGTLVLDMRYQAGEIRINTGNETIKLFNEPVTSLAQFKKVYAEVTEVDEANVNWGTLNKDTANKALLLMDKLTVAEFQLAKKQIKDFKVDDYKLSTDKQFYVKTVDESLVNEHDFKVGDKVKMSHGGSGVVKSLDKESGADDEKYYNIELPNGEVHKHAPNELTKESIVNEAITVLGDRYIRSHGKNPKGFGKWMFSYNKGGDDIFEIPSAMSFADAVKWVKDKAKKDGEDYIYVMESLVNEATYGQNYLYEIATPAPTRALARGLQTLFGKDRVILGDWNSPEGFESVIMLNLTPNDIKKINTEIDDVLIFRMEITNRQEL